MADEDKQRRTIQDYVTLGVHGLTPGITRQPLTTNNFELKPNLISMVQQSQFGSIPMDDPNFHLSVFLEVYNTLKIDGASSHAIYLHLFPFSLRDKTRAWLHSLPWGSITAWDEFTKVFFPSSSLSSKMASLRN